jgi:hypothetical protein
MKLMLKAGPVAAITVALAVACAPRAAGPTLPPTVAAATTTPTTTSAAPATAPPVGAGAIVGLLGYPAEGHPAVTIYAVSTTDRSLFFSVDIPRATTPPKSPFTITVRPGTYNLFAYLEGNDGPAGGAYTEFVRCGLRAGCSDHTPIDVTVRAGETVRDIEVSDWYAPPGTFPPRPR